MGVGGVVLMHYRLDILTYEDQYEESPRPSTVATLISELTRISTARIPDKVRTHYHLSSP